MSNAKILTAVVVTLILGVTIGVWWSHRSANAAGTSGLAAEGERKVLYWHDPMVPSQKFDKPGKSPFMDMPLVPVYADDTGNDAGIKVNSSVTQSLGIRLGKVEKSAVQRPLTAVGSVAFDEHRTQVIQSRVTGYITKLFVKAQLDRVKKGQILAEITSPEWQEAQQEYVALLESTSAHAQELRSAARQRLNVLDVPESVIADIERTHRALPATQITAPLGGVVTELGVREGTAFAAGATLFRINGLESVWVNAQIPEAQVHVVPIGAAATARATAWPGESFPGRVRALLPEVDASSRTFTVRAEIDNARNKLIPGMFISLEIAQPQSEPQLVVASEAVIATGRRTVVIVASKSGSFAVTDVVTGGQVGDQTIILKGLDEGQTVVLSGQFLIDSEANLTSTVSRLSTAADEPKADAKREQRP